MLTANAANKRNISSEVNSEISSTKPFNNIVVLLIDNDELMLTAMTKQLIDWGCQVLTAYDQASCQQKLTQSGLKPDIIIADYHLDYGNNGVELVANLLAVKNWQLPTIICSADPSESVRQHTSDAQCLFLRKPIKSLALKRIMKQVLT